MNIRVLRTLEPQGREQNLISRLSIQGLSPHERVLVDSETVATNVTELLDGVADRGDVAFICEVAGYGPVGYALVTEHTNTWTGLTESFVYAMDVDDHVADHRVVYELLESIRVWGTERGHPIQRLQIGSSQCIGRMVDFLHSIDWSTSAFIPYKLLAPRASLARHSEASPRVRLAREEDFPFICQLLSEAIWKGLSQGEKDLLTVDSLLENVAQDFYSALMNGECFSLVSESVDSRLCGHASVELGGSHLLLGLAEAELIDVSVLPSYSGRGIGSELTKKAISASLDRSNRLIRSTVVVENADMSRVEQVLRQLEHDSWWIQGRIMYYSGLDK